MMREDYTVLSEKDEIEEFMFLGLRKRAGISEIYVISSKDSFPYEVKGIIRDFDELRDLLCWKQKD